MNTDATAPIANVAQGALKVPQVSSPLTAEQELQLLVKEFRTDVFSKIADIDPGDQLEWASLALGWGLGKGLTLEDSKALVDAMILAHF